MKQVTNLKVLPTSYQKPHDPLVKLCEELLEQARSGELQQISAVCSNHNDTWTHAVSSSMGGRLFSIIGGHHCLMADLRDTVENLQDD